VLHVTGALCAPIDDGLVCQVQALLDRGERRIDLDLSGLSDIDAAGLGELVRAHNRARAAAAVVQIVDAPGHVRALLDRTGLAELFGAGRLRRMR
jgi:anti-sigma B factor antagonist